MNKPNFFLIGAPKCGTTSLASWLAEHKNIFMCDPKEPHYFNSDSEHHSVFSLKDYEQLFEGANEAHTAVGEASVWYLISKVASVNILKYQPNAKFIICFRNPIEMAVSLHDQIKYNTDEPIQSFEEAWQAQEARKNGQNIPDTCKDINHLLYGSSCKLGEQYERLVNTVDKEAILPVFVDDLKKSPRDVYLKILRFLDVEDDYRTIFPVVNIAKQRKSLLLRSILRRWFLLKQRLNLKLGFGIANILDKLNQVERARVPISEDMNTVLKDYFREDIMLLSKLTGRDLSHWIK